MTTIVSVYDGFYQLDPQADWANFTAALVSSSYTFDATHASWGTDIASFESTDGSGYSEVTGVAITRDGSSAYPDLNLTFSTSPTFATMTTADYQFVILYNGDTPAFAIDTGAPAALAAQGVSVSGILAVVAGPSH